MEERVKALEDELSKQILINQECVKKMRVMEYTMLKQNKIMRGSGNHQHLTTLGGGTIIGVTQ
ncbi:MAG: hypothetical protein ACMG6E_04740 [Candidatus Roizmanbacteria bacterium]